MVRKAKARATAKKTAVATGTSAKKGGKRTAAIKEEEDVVDWNKLTVAELRKHCEEQGLDTKGTKATLIARLNKDEPPAKLTRQESHGSKTIKEAIKNIIQETKTKKQAKPDQFCSIGNKSEVVEDYDCMLNQTNIGNNNNKFYIIQLLMDQKKNYYTWTRWGRVGESGQFALLGPKKDLNVAIKEFQKKFYDKTRNYWEYRHNFIKYPGKYTQIEMDEDAEYGDQEVQVSTSNVKTEAKGNTDNCKLDVVTRNLVDLIFDENMFTNAMLNMELDIKKMPLGKLSRAQIAKGFDALVELEDAIKKNKPAKVLEDLTSNFYTIIPHNFGRNRPPVINNLSCLQKKKDILIVLLDIEIAQTMQKDLTKGKGKNEPHPLDTKYDTLKCSLEPLKSGDKDYKTIEKYFAETGDQNWLKILQVWKVCRESEPSRFKVFNNLKHRKLLWHGTNVAVVAAILRDGLRIMPHSGGRVGKGIYFASENSKSAGYVGFAPNNTCVMFLNEVALGKEYEITHDDCSLIKAPSGFNSVVARGQCEPDPKKDTTIDLNGHKVIVPQGKPIKTKHTSSSFSQSEYLVYDEGQVHIRYLIQLSHK